MTIQQLLYELNELLRMGIVGPQTTVKIAKDFNRDAPLSTVSHELQINSSPYIRLS